MLFLSFMNEPIELRFNWEVDGVLFLCQERWLSASEGNGTKVTFIERYTETGKQAKDELMKQTTFYNTALNWLKQVSK